MNRIAASPARIPSSAIKRRILVRACPYSGGALVARLLGRYPGVHRFDDSGVFRELCGHPRHLRPWTLVGLSVGRERQMLARMLARAYTELETEPPALPPFDARLRRAFGDSVATLDRLALSAGCRSWVEHTPGVARAARPLERSVPHLRSIHVIRDGRDVVAAHCAAAAEQRDGHCRRSDARQAIECWNRALAVHARCFGRGGHSFVFYEDLLHRPRHELARLAHECGVAPEPGGVADAAGEFDESSPRAQRIRFRELFTRERRRAIESALDLGRYGRLAERLRNHSLASHYFAPPSESPSGMRSVDGP